MKVYLLTHRRNDLRPGGGELVGVFTTEEKARDAIDVFRQRWMFPVSPEIFEIHGHELDADSLLGGFG